ncbi:uncharacterized protein TNCV_1377051 [Trichonephila clavipes]|nr:uncharacterized protein TNCV_1377051 [Trichonephila clavipes]
MSSSPVPLKTHRVGQRCTLNLSRAETSSRWCATRGLLATDHVVLNHGQVTWTAPELAPLLLTTTPHQREDVSALDIFINDTKLELLTFQPRVRDLDHSATVATKLPVDVSGD